MRLGPVFVLLLLFSGAVMMAETPREAAAAARRLARVYRNLGLNERQLYQLTVLHVTPTGAICQAAGARDVQAGVPGPALFYLESKRPLTEGQLLDVYAASLGERMAGAQKITFLMELR